MNIERIIAETDILQFIDQAFCEVHAFGYAADEETEVSRATNILYGNLEKTGILPEQMMELNPFIGEVVRASGEEGFKRGFGIALRMMIAGLNEKKS